MAELVLHIKRGRPHTGQQIISSASFLERQARELSYVWDSLVTADYLLTARDLPGWPGRPPAIDFRKLLLKGLAELKDGLFAHDRIARELSILYGIAERHGLGDFFRKVARNARRSLEGNAISSRRIYLDGSRLGIENVLDTAYFRLQRARDVRNAPAVDPLACPDKFCALSPIVAAAGAVLAGGVGVDQGGASPLCAMTRGGAGARLIYGASLRGMCGMNPIA
jgi:hypothetical protein